MLFLIFLVVCVTVFRSCESALYDVLSARVLAQTSNFKSVTMLSNGDAVAVGYVNGVVGTAYGSLDFIVQRSTPSGEVVWTKQWGSASYDYGLHVISDAADNIYVSGSVYDSFDGNLYHGGHDGAVFKLDSAGNKLFSSQFGTSDDERVSALFIDTTSGLLYATGATTNGPFSHPTETAFIAKLNLTSGAVLQKIALGTQMQTLCGSAIDRAGNVWVGSAKNGLQRFDASFNSNFAATWGSASSCHFSTDANDNKYLSGNTNGGDANVARFDSAGAKMWSATFGGSALDFARASAADLASGRLFVTGVTNSPTFLGNKLNAELNAFLVVLSIDDGSVLYSALYGCASQSFSIFTNGPITYISGLALSQNENGLVLALNTFVSTPSSAPILLPSAIPSSAPVALLPTADPSGAPIAEPTCVLWALGDYGQSCSATCAGLQRVCKPYYLEAITTQEAFYDIIASAVNVRAGGGAIGSPEHFCSQATSASTEVSVPAVLSVVLSAAGNDPVRRTCTYPTTTATDCDAELPMSSSFRRFCPCVNHNCDDSWYLGYSGASCGATCSSVQRTCDATRLSEVVTNTSFLLDTNGPVAESAAAFCTLGTNLLDVATAPAALTFVQGSTNQTLCAFPTSVEQLHGDCDVAFTGAFPAQRFCNCRVPAHIPHRKLITKVESSAVPASRLRGAKYV